MPADVILALASLFIQTLPYITQEIALLSQKGAIPDDQWTAFKAAVGTLTSDPAWTVTEPDV